MKFENFPVSANDNVPAISIVLESADKFPTHVAFFVSSTLSIVVRFENTTLSAATVIDFKFSSNCAANASKYFASTISCPPRFNGDNILESFALSDGSRHRYRALSRRTDVVVMIPSGTFTPISIASVCHAPNVPYAWVPSINPILSPPTSTICLVRNGDIVVSDITTTP